MAKSIPEGPGSHPFAELIGLRLGPAEAGRNSCSLTPRPELMNPNRVVHGAVAYALVDTGMGLALYSVLEEHESCATIEIKITYLRSVQQGELECETRVLERRGHYAILESEVRNGKKTVARALGTYAILKSDAQRD